MVIGRGDRPARGNSVSGGRRLGNALHAERARSDASLSSFEKLTINMNSTADMNPSQVIEYLMKKGYLRTEQVLRQESAQVDKDGRPVFDRDEYGNEKYIRGFELLSSWIDSNLDIYKVSQQLYTIQICC